MTVPGPSYPGNPSLSLDVRRRVEATYHQSLELARQGNRQEASLGCDFVLQLDPDYTPAQELLERLESGKPLADDAGPAAAAAADPSRHREAEELFGGLDDGGEPLAALPDLPELADLPELPAPATPAAPAPAPAADDLAGRLAALVAARRDAEAVDLAGGHRDRVAADPRLAELAQTAAGRLEAAPYVERFLAAAREARLAGDAAAAAAALDKVRALDPTHPELAPAEAGEVGDATVDAVAPAAADPLAGAPAAAPDDPFAALGGSDEERRVDELLAEGQAAFDRGDHQGAIDAWSRIFLIDIEHREAARRIEEARRLKAEQERHLEEAFHEAEQALAAGDREAARAGFERVLAAQPGHAEARQRLDDLDAGGDGLAAAIGAAASASGMAGGAAVERPPAAEPLREEILVPPEPGETPPPPAATPGRSLAASREGGARRRFLAIGTLVLLAVLAAGWLVWDNRDSIFPNAEEEAAAGAVEEDAIARATRLHESGRTAIAINQLRRLPPTAPEYAEAQALISQWEAESAAPRPPAEAGEPAEDPAVVEQRGLVAEARAAVAAGDYLGALTRLERAAEVAPLDAESAAFRAEVERRLAPVARLVELIRQGEHERALPDLWRRLEAQPDDAVVRGLIVEAYYRMGVRDLQRGDAASAAEHLAEAAGLAPDDPLLARHQRFAAAYADREKDLLYRIYVKYLPPR